MRNSILAGVTAGAFIIGAAGTTLVVPSAVDAADPTPIPAATATPSATPSTTESTESTDTTPGFCGREHGPGLDTDDLAAAAKVLGMTEAALQAELEVGKTAADVAKAHGVDVQEVIDAVIAYDTADIAAAIAAGTMTQAQADERLANLTQHVTDEVNATGLGHGGRGGHGHGHHDVSGDEAQSPAASPSTGTGTGTGTGTSA